MRKKGKASIVSQENERLGGKMDGEIIYLACPYSHEDEEVKRMRYEIVTEVAFDLHKKGLLVYSPLTHNIPLDQRGIGGTFARWQNFDLAMLGRVDRLFVLQLPGFEESKGVQGEIDFAKASGIPVDYLPCPNEKLAIWHERQRASHG